MCLHFVEGVSAYRFSPINRGTVRQNSLPKDVILILLAVCLLRPRVFSPRLTSNQQCIRVSDPFFCRLSGVPVRYQVLVSLVGPGHFPPKHHCSSPEPGAKTTQVPPLTDTSTPTYWLKHPTVPWFWMMGFYSSLTRTRGPLNHKNRSPGMDSLVSPLPLNTSKLRTKIVYSFGVNYNLGLKSRMWSHWITTNPGYIRPRSRFT